MNLLIDMHMHTVTTIRRYYAYRVVHIIRCTAYCTGTAEFFYLDFGIGASYFWNARINSFAFPPLKNLSSIGKFVLGDGGM